jgi:hypothetical protein
MDVDTSHQKIRTPSRQPQHLHVPSRPAAPCGGIWQHEQVHAGEPKQRERNQGRVRHPLRWLLLAHRHEDDVRDDAEREDNSQPAVDLPNRFVPPHLCDFTYATLLMLIFGVVRLD